jgi:tetrahydromethanopterin S-methyltransferase subunit H
MVKDRKRGILDRERLEEMLHRAEEAAEETETPWGIMISAETEGSIRSYLEQVSKLTALPLLIDSASKEVRLEGARAAGEMGITDRVIYNSINSGTSEEELEELSGTGLRSAILLAFSPRDTGIKGKVYLLEDGHGLLNDGLINLAGRSGIDRPLVDLAVMSMDQNAGSALRAIMVTKAKWGLPSGCALHNAVESWDIWKTSDPDQPFRSVDMASTIAPIMTGADFVMFGPLEAARRSMYAATFVDEIMSQAYLDR